MRGYAKTTIKNPQAALRLGWHDFSFSRGCVPLPNLAGQADAQTLGGIYEVPPFFCSPACGCYLPGVGDVG
jgi:hypothetical protein